MVKLKLIQFDHNLITTKCFQTRQLKSQDYMNRQRFQLKYVSKLNKREL